MLDYLFERRPEYNENGEIVSYTITQDLVGRSVYVIFHCFKDKAMKK